MKKTITTLAILALTVLMALPAQAAKLEVLPMGGIDLTVATSSLTYYSRAINPHEYSYIGFQVNLDVTSGGGAGAGIITFEGRTDTISTWQPIPFLNASDSLDVISSYAPASTSDLLYSGYISFTILNMDDLDQVLAGEITVEDVILWVPEAFLWPYEEIRMKVVDTNWNAAVKVDGFWLLKK
jgi:hypothetical protein